MSSQQYLFLLTIGPVQGFIAQARKTRDLYAGSAILGELTNAGIQCVKDKNKQNIIIVPDPDLKAKPNRFLARIYDDDPLSFGKAVEERVRSAWTTIALQAFRDADAVISKAPLIIEFDQAQKALLEKEALEQVIPCGAANQILDLLEINWVILPFDEDRNDYRKMHEELQQRLAAIKNTRKFNQIDEPPARKCSLDGERNALYYRPSASNKIAQVREVQDKHLQNGAVLLTNNQLLDVGEGLSAVSLIKRFYSRGRDFPSTPRIALLNVIRDIENSDPGKEYKRLFHGDKHVNEQLYFEENLTAAYLRKQGYEELVEQGYLSKIRGLQQKIADLFRDKPQKMSKYYALLVFDGDSMGSTWSGDTIADSLRLEEFQSNVSRRLQLFQQELATRLGIFAEYATAFLNGEAFGDVVQSDPFYKDYIGGVVGRDDSVYSQKGRCVYAGGDDFLGFVNLNNLFSVMKGLRDAYDILVSRPLEGYLDSGKHLTFSAGVVIAHYKTPLNEVLRRAREMEHKAKQIDADKDAFAIAVLKHSGDIEEARYKWKVDTEWLIDDFGTLVRELASKKISNNFIKAIELEFRRLSDCDGNFVDDPLLKIELPRLIARSCSNDLDSNGRKTQAEKVNRHVCRLYEGAFIFDPVARQKSPGIKSLSTFTSALNICDFIWRETDSEEENEQK